MTTSPGQVAGATQQAAGQTATTAKDEATQVGQTIASTLTGTQVDQALKTAQSATERTMRQAGYPK